MSVQLPQTSPRSHQDEQVSLWWWLSAAEDGRFRVERLKKGTCCWGITHTIEWGTCRHCQQGVCLCHETWRRRRQTTSGYSVHTGDSVLYVTSVQPHLGFPRLSSICLWLLGVCLSWPQCQHSDGDNPKNEEDKEGILKLFQLSAISHLRSAIWQFDHCAADLQLIWITVHNVFNRVYDLSLWSFLSFALIWHFHILYNHHYIYPCPALYQLANPPKTKWCISSPVTYRGSHASLVPGLQQDVKGTVVISLWVARVTWFTPQVGLLITTLLDFTIEILQWILTAWSVKTHPHQQQVTLVVSKWYVVL